MREVTQTILHEQDPVIPGNCLQAAVASLLDLDLDAVPHFVTHPDWTDRLVAFGREHGYLVSYRSPDWLEDPLPDRPVSMGIACGRSPRGVQHAVVVIDDVQVWDPHPSRAGLLTVSGILAFDPLTGSSQ